MSKAQDEEITVESALKELREMYPDCYRRIEMIMLENPDGSLNEESGWQVTT